MRRKYSFYFSPSILVFLMFSISFNNEVNGYYSKQLFLPSGGYLNQNLFEFKHPSKIGDYNNEEQKIVIIEEENEDNNNELLETTKILQKGNNQQKEIPRRQMRHLLANEFGNERIGRQFKRMRPCFYSPIQCLMRKRRSEK